MDHKKELSTVRVLGELRGHLWKRLNVEATLDDGAQVVSDCLLLDLMDHHCDLWPKTYEEQVFHVVAGLNDEDRKRRDSTLAASSCSETDWVLWDASIDDGQAEQQRENKEELAVELIQDFAVEGPPVSIKELHIILKPGQISKTLMQRVIASGQVSTLGLPWADAVAYLPALLDALPDSSPLRHLFLFKGRLVHYADISSSQMEQVLDALCNRARSDLLDGVALDPIFGTLEKLVINAGTQLSELCSSVTSFALHGYGVHLRWTLTLRAPCKLKQLWSKSGDFEVNSLLQLMPNCPLTRLDLQRHRLGDVQAVVTAIRHIKDLGLGIYSASDVKGLLHSQLHKTILTLRLHFWNNLSDGIWNLLALQLLSKESTSTIRFLDCHFFMERRVPANFLSSLTGNKNSLTAFRLQFKLFSQQPHREVFKHLPMYLRSSHVLFFEVRCLSQPEFDEWECTNALINNFHICALSLPWRTPAAEAQAASLIRRNQLYRAGKLLKEPQVRPNTAKLFLCGHAQVGKTTLSRALQYRDNWSSSLLGNLWGLNSEPNRTRGMEFHPLAFGDSKMQFLICDLAGQEEFHVFHQYFMNASNNDLFLVVCKIDTTSPNSQVFEHQLDYWFRFIVSHRSGRNIKTLNGTTDADMNHGGMKPKVIVVANFFGQHDPKTMINITNDYTVHVMKKFSEVLDFSVVGANNSKNLFSLNAKMGTGVHLLKRRLKSLLQNLDKTARPIPGLCYEISAKLTERRQPTRWNFPNFFATEQRKLRLLTSYTEILEMVSDGQHPRACIRVQAALQELHNQGFLLFFPSPEMDEAIRNSPTVPTEKFMSTLVITDVSWFCNKLVGNLLGTRLDDEPRRACPWVWLKKDIKVILRGQGCEEEHLKEILRYLQNLELCVSLGDNDPSGLEKGSLLFPALVEEREIKYPNVRCSRCNATSTRFFGRRIRCMNSEIHLIPFGVFTRLQVKLHKQYCANDKSFAIGYGWVSFMKGNVGVIVRFGSGEANEAWESKQWVDILIFCAGSCSLSSPEASSSSRIMVGGHHYGQPMNDVNFVAAENVMDEIKSLIYAICKSEGFGGIATVELQEWVLQNDKPGTGEVLLSEIMERVRKEGLQESHHAWALATGYAPCIDLLLPREIEGHVKGQLEVLEGIEEEFALNDHSGQEFHADEIQEEAESSSGATGNKQIRQQLSGKFGVLLESMESLWETLDQRWETLDQRWEKQDQRWETLEQKLKTLEQKLELIRNDIHQLGVVLQQAQQNIIANCSTHLLRHELTQDRAYPIYPFLADAQGKLAPLWGLFGKRAVVHFMCESPEGPHPVKDQKGKEVTIQVKEWVPKVARVVVPAVKVICVLARVAASVYLPGSQVFMPSPEALVSGLGFQTDALQHVILPKALEALLDQLPEVNHKAFLTKQGSTLDRKEVKEAMQALLQNVELDMVSDFGLQRVYFDNIDGHTPFWVCRHHVGNRKRLAPICNPYK